MTTRRARAKGPSRARLAAFEVLRSIRSDRTDRADPASALHSGALDGLSPEDRRLTTEIVYGVLRWRGRLDFELEGSTRRPLARSHPDVVEALRIGLYQIRNLERVPPRAAVDESVRLAKRSRSAAEAGFVNGVLRALLRAEPPAFPSVDEDPIHHLTHALSHPEWLVRRYLDRLGVERASARCRVHNEPPATYVRVTRELDIERTRKRLEEEGVATRTIAWLPRGLLVVRGSPVDTELYRSGDIVIQDGGSQLVPLLLGVSRGDDDDDDVLDVCAAPGGKTSILAEDTRASVFAFDARYSRARLLRDTTLRAGSTNVHVGVADGRLLPFSRRFPRILLDVPCSSLGTLRRNPDIKWRVAESDLAGFAAVQRELLARASAHLEPYGRLAYATCSTEPEENEGVVQEFLSSDAGSGFRLLDPSPSLPAEARHFVGEDGCYRTFPERDGIDAYFAAILTR